MLDVNLKWLSAFFLLRGWQKSAVLCLSPPLSGWSFPTWSFFAESPPRAFWTDVSFKPLIQRLSPPPWFPWSCFYCCKSLHLWPNDPRHEPQNASRCAGMSLALVAVASLHMIMLSRNNTFSTYLMKCSFNWTNVAVIIMYLQTIWTQHTRERVMLEW